MLFEMRSGDTFGNWFSGKWFCGKWFFCNSLKRRLVHCGVNTTSTLVVTLGTLAFLLAPANLLADITLPNFFSDHMVIQQNARFPVRGQADPGHTLTIEFGDLVASVTVDETGVFEHVMQTPPASGPWDLEIADAENQTKVVISDIMVGDVWVCVGQANMEMTVAQASAAVVDSVADGSGPSPGAMPNTAASLNSAADAAANGADASVEGGDFAAAGKIRLLKLPQTMADQPLFDLPLGTPWKNDTSDHVQDFSALAWFFGQELSRTDPDTPIGLIEASHSASRCESWCSLESIEASGELDTVLSFWEDSGDVKSAARPATLFNGMIAPIARFPIKGVVCSQGESDVGRGATYAVLFSTMIQDWRRQFQQPDLPFFFTQVAPFRFSDHPADALPEVWDAQIRTSHSISHAAIAPAMDLGDGNLIYRDKHVIAARLARIARATVASAGEGSLTGSTQQRPAPVTGPMFESMQLDAQGALVRFRGAGAGLRLVKEALLSEFQICGQDNEYHDAVAEIVGPDTVRVRASGVTDPQAVRYCWTDDARSPLINSEGLPAFPFRWDRRQRRESVSRDGSLQE